MKPVALLIISTFVISTMCKAAAKRKATPPRTEFSERVASEGYLDKTECIKTLLEDKEKTVYLRAPRRFGKTLNLQMLKRFLEIQLDDKGVEMKDKTKTRNFQSFINTKIYKEHSIFFNKHFGKYPVIYFDYGLLNEADSYENALTNMKTILWNTYMEHGYLLSANEFWEKNGYKQYFDQFISKDLSSFNIEDGLDWLTSTLEEYYGKKPIILIDNYDAYVYSMMIWKSGDDVMELMVRMHEHLLPDDSLAEKMVFTGTLHAETIHVLADEQYVKDYKFLDDHPFCDCYGMTENELGNVLRNYTDNSREVAELKANISLYYGGYRVWRTDAHLYNTLSVYAYLRARKQKSDNALTSYWFKPKYYNSLLCLLYYTHVIELLVYLLQSKSALVECDGSFSEIDVKHLKNIIHSAKADAERDPVILGFNFLMQYGYLSYVNHTEYVDCERRVRIANEETRHEIKRMLFDAVVARFGFGVHTVEQLLDLLGGHSKETYGKVFFDKLLTRLNNLFSKTNYSADVVNDFCAHFCSLLIARFQVFTKRTYQELDYEHLPVEFHNKFNVSFYINIRLLNINTKVLEDEMKNCSRLAINKAIKQRYSFKKGLNRYKALDAENPKVICLGICLGIQRSQGEIHNRLIGIAFSKQLSFRNNIDSISFLVQQS